MRLGLFAIVAVVSSFSHSQNYYWSASANFPGLASDDAVAFFIDETIYYGTGNHGGFAESHRFFAFNLSSSQWKEIAAFPMNGRQYSSLFVLEKKAYLVGGLDLNNNALNEVWQYDPKTNHWEQKQHFPFEKRWGGITFVIGENAYYGTGKNHANFFNDLWQYNAGTDSWVEMTELPSLPVFRACGFSLYNSGYICLGIDCTHVLVNDLWEYNALENAWTKKTDFAGSPRYYAGSGVLNGHAIISGGSDLSNTFFADAYYYSPLSDSWHSIPLVSENRRGMATCSVPGIGIYFLCGLDENLIRTNTVSFLHLDDSAIELIFIYQNEQSLLNISGLTPNERFQVFSVDGKLIVDGTTESDYLQLNTTSWSKGVYIISSDSSGGAKVIVW